MTPRRPLTVNVLTLFPELLETAFGHSILRRAVEKGLFRPHLVNIRDYTRDRHRTADDKPYGGGRGMVLKIEPIARALLAVRRSGGTGKIYLLSPTGRRFDQNFARQLSRVGRFTLICGRYEGVDERVAQHLCDGEISIGDFVLSGGEPAAAVVVDAAVRLVPGVLGAADSAAEDSFSRGFLDYPHYTRPPRYRGWSVPKELLTGDHGKVLAWRRGQQVRRTLEKRPDLFARLGPQATGKNILPELTQMRRRGRKSRRQGE